MKTRIIGAFTLTASLSAALTFAPRALGYWKVQHSVSCVPYAHGYGFSDNVDGMLHVDQFGTRNTGSKPHYLQCPDTLMDSNNGYNPYVRASFYRYTASSQIPRLRFCSSWYGCSAYYYPSNLSATGWVYIDGLASVWRFGARNSVEVPLDPTFQSSNELTFTGFSVGNEYPNNGYF